MKNKLDLGIPRKHVRLFNRTLKERMESEKKKRIILNGIKIMVSKSTEGDEIRLK